MSAEKEKSDKKKKAEEKARESLLEFVKKTAKISDISYADQYEAVTDVISTGHAELDRLISPIFFEKTGKAGVPRGFVCEFYGPNAGGKSSLAMRLTSNVTKNGGHVFWVDAEGSFVPEWARTQGVVAENVIRIGTGHSGEEYLETVCNVAKTGKFELVVIDSVTALRPKRLLEQSLEEHQVVGAGAQMMSRIMPILVGAAAAGNCTIVLINQVRQKMGVMYGNPETTPYGEAVGFYSSLRLRLQQVGNKKNRGIMKGEDEIGIRSNVHIIKSRFGPPHRETILPIYYSDIKPYPLDQLIDAAIETKIIKSRSKKMDNGEPLIHFTLEGHETLKSIPGFDEFKSGLIDDPNALKGIFEKLTELKIVLATEVHDYIKGLGKSSDPLDVESTDS